MPWQNQGGGGPWGGGPWGPKPGNGSTPPNLEEILRRGQDRIRNVLPGGMGGGRGLAIVIGAVGLIWLMTGFYQVDAGEQGVELMFGRWTGATTGPGLHWWAPAPIGEVVTPNTERLNRTDVGFRSSGAQETRLPATTSGRRNDVPQESLMLTSDQNIADLDFTVYWKIGHAGRYLYGLRDPEQTVKAVSESAMREVIGRNELQAILTTGRAEVESQARKLLQQVLNSYGSGVQVQNVQLLQVEPPAPVIDMFNEVQRARQDRDRLQNEAEAYSNRIVPTARGEVSRIVQDATGYKEQLTKQAEGEAQRFQSIYAAYLTAPEVTRRRMYLDTMSEILNKANKIIIDPATAQGGNGVVPYLPLNDLSRRVPAPAAPAVRPGGAEVPR
ncbi:MAG: FtsH protease activity modulator HflK [Alphaproteobacteria bacterium]|nr:FtsH protease activity modulator HflK [Alphaproteobacteria bacterium]